MDRTSTAYETQAEARAYAYAEKLAAAGWTVTVTITDHAPARYRNGEIMLPGMRQASFLARRNWYDASFSGHWLTITEPTQGGRRTTRFTGGHRYPLTQPAKAIPQEHQLAIWADIETDSNTAGAQGSVTTKREQGRTY